MKRLFLVFFLFFFTLSFVSAETVYVPKTSFNAGEVAPSIYGRIDLSKYPNALKEMTNFVPTPQGSAVRRPGFRYIADAKNSNRIARLIPFQFNVDQSYVIEAGHNYFRFYKDGGQIWTVDSYTKLLLHMDGKNASTTFSDSGNTDHTSSITVNGNSQLNTSEKKFGTASGLFDGSDWLSIADHADWYLADYEWMIDFWVKFNSISSSYQGIFGQWVDEDNHYALIMNNTELWFISRDTATLEISLRVTGQTIATDTWYHVAVIRGWGGSQNNYAITLMGSSVGTLTDSDSYPDLAGPFTVGRANTSSAGNEIYTDGYIEEFRVTNIGGTGLSSYRWTANFDPAETEYPFPDESGSVYEISHTYDEPDLAELKWAQSADYVYIVHPDFTPRELTRTDHDAWTISDTTFTATPSEWNAAGATNCGSGKYPQSIAFHQDRLIFGGCYGLPDRLWFSKTSDFTNFTTGTNDDDAFTINLLSQSIDAIRWMYSLRKLLIGTLGGEWWMQGSGADSQITPTSKAAYQDTNHGSANVSPVAAGNSLIFIQRPGRKVRGMSYDWESDAFLSTELSILAEHLTKNNTITELAFQNTPYQIIWAVRNDGKLLALTYLKEHDVIAWSLHETDGEFESITVIPGLEEDELWAVVKRDIDGSTVRYVERMDDFFKSSDLDDAFFVDSGLSYEGAATTSVSGLDHLEGETVYALYDGVVGTDYTVTSGAITVGSASSKIHVGLGYTSDLETLDIDMQTSRGVTTGTNKRITEITFRLEDSAGGEYGPDFSTLNSIRGDTLFTGVVEGMSFSHGYDVEARVCIRQDDPLPLTVNSLTMKVEAR